jgi:hypothetical protein
MRVQESLLKFWTIFKSEYEEEIKLIMWTQNMKKSPLEANVIQGQKGKK